MGSIAVVNLLLLGGLCLIPFVMGDFFAYQVGLYLLYGIAAQGIGLTWGRGGFLPLGNALFFGVSAYFAAAILVASDGNGWAAIFGFVAVALALAGLAYGLAALIFRGRRESGPYFSLITLALVLIAEELSMTTPKLTGGFNGVSGYPELAGLDPFGNLYFVIVGLAVVVTAGLMALDRLPAGLVLRAMAANEPRLQLLGMPTHLIKAACFALAAFVTALAGALYALQQGIVTPPATGFLLSTELVIWAAVGGRFHPLGPLAGAVVIGMLSATLRDTTPYWEVLVALLFLTVVLLAPGGAAHLVERGLARIGITRRVSKSTPRVAPPSQAAKADGALSFTQIELSVGTVEILRGVNFKCPESGVLSVIGPNGAGKTSTINVLTGTMRSNAGHIRLGNTDITNLPPHRALWAGIGRKLQVPSVFYGLSVADNLRLAMLAGRARPLDALNPRALNWQGDRLDAVLDHPKVPLRNELAKDAASLPQGHRQLLEFAMTVAAEPRILLLDEPSAGLSPAETTTMLELIRDYLKATDAFVLIVEHDMALLDALGGLVLVMHQGQVLATGPMQEIRADPRVREIYSGGSK